MASSLMSCEPPPHRREPLILSGLPPLENPSSTVHVYGNLPQNIEREELAKLCANWMMGGFECPNIPAPPETNGTLRPIPLDEFIAFILRRLEADPAVAFCALYTLNRLKEAKPGLIMTSGHGLFFAAFLVAGKVLLDTPYSNSDMAKITQGMFPLWVVNQMERQFLQELDWVVRPPDVKTAREFEQQVRRYYTAGPRPWLGPPRHHTTSTTLVATNAPRNDWYPSIPPYATNNPIHHHPYFQPQPAYTLATARPQLRANTLPAMSSASHSWAQPRPTHHDHHHNPTIPNYLPPLFHAGYPSASSSANPSVVTPEGYQDHWARTQLTGSRDGPPVVPGSPGYVLVGDYYASKFGSAAGESRMVDARNIYSTARPGYRPTRQRTA